MDEYQITLNKRQLKALSYACNEFSRLICGQDMSFQSLMEAAWTKRCKQATGKSMDSEFEGGWKVMRAHSTELCKEIKRRFWGLASDELHGIHYDETADILYDIHQVLRHQLWLDLPDDTKAQYTVDAFPATQFGSEALIKIQRGGEDFIKITKINQTEESNNTAKNDN